MRLAFINDVMNIHSLFKSIKKSVDRSANLPLSANLHQFAFVIREEFPDYFWTTLQEGIRYNIIDPWGACYLNNNPQTGYLVDGYQNNVCPNPTVMGERAGYVTSLAYYLGEAYTLAKYSLRYVKQNEIVGFFNAANRFIASPHGLIGMAITPGSQASDVADLMFAKEKEWDKEKIVPICFNSAAGFLAGVSTQRNNKALTVDEYVANMVNFIMADELELLFAIYNITQEHNKSVDVTGADRKSVV